MTHQANGHEPVDLAHVESYAEEAVARLRAQVTELRVLLTDEDRVQAMLRAKLGESKTRQTSLRRAIDALDPQSKSDAPRRGRPPSGKTAGGFVRPNDESLERTLYELVARGKPLTIDGLFEDIGSGNGISRDTIRRSLYALRDDGRVRAAGRTDRGGMLFAPMPEELTETSS